MDLMELVASIRINLDEFDRGLNSASTKFKSFSDNLSKVGSNMKDLLSPAVDGFKAVEGVGQTAAGAIKKGLAGFAAAATAVGGFGTAAVKSGMSFDSTMSKVAATVGWTTDELHDQTSIASAEFSELRKKALEMGATTQFSASEAADALTYMAMAGWKTDDMLGGIKGIMDLAAASGEDLASTSDIVTDALTAFGLSAGDSGHFADILAAASSNANTNVSMMGETFKYAAPVAGALGYTAEDTALAIGLMANSGIKASQAGTTLRGMLTRLAKPTKQSIVAMEELGISLDDGEGNMKSFKEIMDDLRSGFGELMIPQGEFSDRLSDLNGKLESGEIKQKAYDAEVERLIGLAYGAEGAEKAKYAAMLAGQESMSGLLAIVSAAPEDYEKLTQAIYECDGAAAQMAATMMDNLAGDMKYFESALESLQIAISDALTPTLREFVQFGQKAMAELLSGFQGGGVSGFMSALSGIVTEGVTMLAQKAPEFASVSLQFVAALADGILGAKDSIADSLFEVLYTITDGFGTWLSSNSTELADFGLDIVTIIFEGFRDAGWIISQNIGEFVPLIAAAFFQYHSALFEIGIDILGGIGRGIIEHKEEIAKWADFAIKNMAISLRENAPDIIEGAVALLDALVGAIIENMPLILEAGGQIIASLVEGISGSLPALAVVAATIVPYIVKAIDVVTSIGKTIGSIVDLVSGGLNTIMGIGSKLMGGIQALWGLIAANPVAAAIVAVIAVIALLWTNCEEFREFFIGLWEGFKEVIAAFAEWFQGAWEGVKEFFSGLWEGFKEIIIGFGEWLSETVAGIVEFFMEAWNGIGEFFSELWESLKEIIGLFGEWLSEKMGEIVEWVKEKWNGIAEFFSEVWQGIMDVFQGVAEFFGEVFGAAAEAVQLGWQAVVEFFQGVWEGVVTVFSVAAEVLGGFFTAAAEAVQAVWTSVGEFFQGVWEGIQAVFEPVAEVLGGFFQAALEAVQGIWEAAAEFFSGVWESIQEVFADVADVLGGFFEAAWDVVQGVWEAAVDFFSGVADGIYEVFEAVTAFLGETFQAAWDAVQTAWDAAIDFFGDIWSNIKEAGSEAANAVRDALKEAWNAIKEAWDGATEFFKGIYEDIVGVFKDIWKDFKDIGKHIVDGIKDGVLGAWESFTTFMSNKISGIINSVKEKLGIHSPSKVFAGIGENMALGLAEGWDDEYSGIKRQIERGMDFGTVNVGLNATRPSYGADTGYSAGNAQQPAYGGNTYVTINSPKAVDAITAAREWKKTTQRMAIGYV